MHPSAIITIKYIREIWHWQISISTASRKLSLCRDALGKQKPKVITIKEFCDYYGLEVPKERI